MPQKYRCINWALKLKACFKCVDVQCTVENWNSRPGFLHCYRQTLPCFCNLTESENSPELKGPCKTIYEKGEPRCDYHIPEEIMWFVKRSTCLSFKWKVKLLKLYLAVLSCSEYFTQGLSQKKSSSANSYLPLLVPNNSLKFWHIYSWQFILEMKQFWN